MSDWNVAAFDNIEGFRPANKLFFIKNITSKKKEFLMKYDTAKSSCCIFCRNDYSSYEAGKKEGHFMNYHHFVLEQE